MSAVNFPFGVSRDIPRSNEYRNETQLDDPLARRISAIAARTLGIIFTISSGISALAVVPLAFISAPGSIALLLTSIATAVVGQDYLSQGKISESTFRAFMFLFHGSFSLTSFIMQVADWSDRRSGLNSGPPRNNLH